ncbi:MAG: hypothetical protein HY318_09290, partial [Armatimonadetes bacterium]|nr:hypothetical protein [Armatimonadota bacterium]
MLTRAFDNGVLRFHIAESLHSGERTYALSAIEVAPSKGWQPLLEGIPGQEFATSLGSIPAHTSEVRQTTDGGWEVTMSGRGEGWEAREIITLAAGQPFIRRTQTYRFLKSCDLAICPGFRLRSD